MYKKITYFLGAVASNTFLDWYMRFTNPWPFYAETSLSWWVTSLVIKALSLYLIFACISYFFPCRKEFSWHSFFSSKAFLLVYPILAAGLFSSIVALNCHYHIHTFPTVIPFLLYTGSLFLCVLFFELYRHSTWDL